jgi:hypothetical protein
LRRQMKSSGSSLLRFLQPDRAREQRKEEDR